MLIAFDIGNVLAKVDLDKFITALTHYNVCKSYSEAYDFLESIQSSQDLGLYDMKQAIRRFYPGTFEDVVMNLFGAWNSTLTKSEIMINMTSDLIRNGHQIAILSNIGFDHLAVVCNWFPYWDKFDLHLSCCVGARKPTKLFFQSFSNHKEYQQVLFFDDRPENIEAAKPYLNPIQFNINNFESDLKASEFILEKINTFRAPYQI